MASAGSPGGTGGANTGGGGGGTGWAGNLAVGGGSGIVILKVSGGQSVRFSSGVTYTINSAVAGYKIYSITAAGAADTVTFI